MPSHYLLLFLLLPACQPSDPPSDSPASPPPTDYKIAYNVLLDPDKDNYEVFIMNMDGSNPKNISRSTGVDWVYYAYGDKIYFISDRDSTHRLYFLYEMDANGNNVRKISDTRLADSWLNSRRDGKEMIVKPDQSVDSTHFHVLDLATGAVTATLSPGLVYFSDPAFSPDGTEVAFRGAKLRSKREQGFVDEIYLMGEHGTNVRQLTHYPVADTTAEWYAYKAGPPHWHPSGQWISYQSKQEGKYSLFGVQQDGTAMGRLTGLELQEGWHAWSSDGHWLAVEVFDQESSQFGIFLYDWNSKTGNILTDSTYQYQQAPVFVEVTTKDELNQ